MFRRTTTVLSRAFIRVSICRTEACQGGDDGHADLRLPCDWGGSLDGLEMELTTLERLGLGKVYCPHCRQPHQMVGIKYWLSETYLFETEPVEPVKAA
jgi:hypothetical protein